MDAVTNITTAASKAIFGEEATQSEAAGREPVSGQMGNVAVGEPYDKGNMGAMPTSPPHPFAAGI